MILVDENKAIVYSKKKTKKKKFINFFKKFLNNIIFSKKTFIPSTIKESHKKKKLMNYNGIFIIFYLFLGQYFIYFFCVFISYYSIFFVFFRGLTYFLKNSLLLNFIHFL